jgi:enoyl-CoA hydratase
MTTVLTDFADRIAVITINRPEARNAIDLVTAEAIAAAVDEFEARDDLTVTILTGAGGSFCAGLDLKAFDRHRRQRAAGRPGGRAPWRSPRNALPYGKGNRNDDTGTI